MKKRELSAYRKRAIVLGVIACLVIPVFTFTFASKGGLIASNLSKVGNMIGNNLPFIIWGLICAFFFHSTFLLIFDLSGCRRVKIVKIMQIACCSLVLCTLFPFLPDRFPTLSFLHSIAGYVAMFLTLMATLIITLDLKRFDPDLSRRSLAIWIANFLVCALFALATGISGLTESMFIVLYSLHLFWMFFSIHRAGKAEKSESLKTGDLDMLSDG